MLLFCWRRPAQHKESRTISKVEAKPRRTVFCRNLDQAIGEWTAESGFRLDEIRPADAPRIAELSKNGERLRLVQDPPPNDSQGDGWHSGRAGMQYRDLLPTRLGGQCIASHIRIPQGGPVADYVHHHDVRFQVIFCLRGWVEVVYQDQGPPFRLQPGDGVLQPPGIRHRVLQASQGLEVFECCSPADHATRVEHEIELPTTTVNPDREFGGQRFCRFQARLADWRTVKGGEIEICDTGIGAASSGAGDVRWLRGIGLDARWIVEGSDTQRILFLDTGSAILRVDGVEHQLQEGDCRLLAPGNELQGGAKGFTALLVSL